MAIFKCKMCGGTLEINNKESIATCEYCGTQQTLPKLDDEKRTSILDRANHFRRNNEFDKAAGIYEQILTEDGTDAEVYWSLVLCRFGIEYVEDPATHKRVPTVNRAQLTSIFDDSNYKLAVQYADNYQKGIYEAEAAAINEIQKGILAISQKEEPFDIFICYKETDNNARRTMDSVLAHDMYNQLTEAGFKVFFSRITLEDKLGTAYEPYIFAALNSSKVMIAVGTKPEHFNAVWVKNEWSRYLALIKEGKKKTLIPAYKDMDPYDLPYEFSHLQAQDMGKLGYMQDLIRGIKKIVGEAQPKSVEGTVEPTNTTDVLLKRGYIFLEDYVWDKADEYFERVLDLDPENTEAYIGKMLALLNVKNLEDLVKVENPFNENVHFLKAVRYADNEGRAKLEALVKENIHYNEQKRLKADYKKVKAAMENAKTERELRDIASKFSQLGEYLDAHILSEEYNKKANEVKNEYNYASAIESVNKKYINLEDRIYGYKNAITLLEEIPEYKDSKERISELKNLLKDAESEIKRKNIRSKKIKIILAIIFLSALVVGTVFVNSLRPILKYNEAKEFLANKDYEGAYNAYFEIKDYKDSEEKLVVVGYEYLNELIADEKYEDASDVIDSIEKITDIYKDDELFVNAKYEYVLRNQNNSNPKTYRYLKLFREEQYKDAEKIWKEIYAFTVDVKFSDKNDTTAPHMPNIDGSGSVTCYAKAIGGTPVSNPVNVKIVYSDGYESVIESAGWDGCHADYRVMVIWDSLEDYSGQITAYFYDEFDRFVGSGSVNIY